jgi:purine catabolism regulator
VTLTVRDIVGLPGMSLRSLTGDGRSDRAIRWVHASELEDPTPWLKGGELLLTTGMGVGDTPAAQRAYVRRLVGAGVGGLGFGLGFGFDTTPRALVTEAAKHDFPLFEVPYPVPFIAITEAVFTRLLAEQYDTLQRAVDAEHVLTRAVLEGAGIEGVASSLGRVVKGWALLFDLHGNLLASTGRAASLRKERIWDELKTSRPDGPNFSISLVDRGHHVWAQPVSAAGRVEAFLAIGKPEQPSQVDRIVAGHALSLFAIELAKSRAVAEAQRRLQGDFFEELAGGIGEADAARGLARFGFARDATVVVVALEPIEAGSVDPQQLALAATDHLSRMDAGYLVSAHRDGAYLLLAAAGDGYDPSELTTALAARLGVELRAGSGSPSSAAEVGRSLREARYALQVCRLEGWPHAGFEDLGTYRLLLSMAEPDALRAFADALLAPLDSYDHEHNGELIGSLQAFLHHNARWETAAAQLFVHRHTLRYRMRKVEELTGRDLTSSFDRMEFWLALRARDLLSTDREP